MPIVISFETEDLLKCCSFIDAAEQTFGRTHAEALITLIADAEAFDHVNDLIDFLGTDGTLSEDDSLLISIGSEYQGKFVAAGVRFGRDDVGRVDWKSVQRLKLMEINKR